MRSLCVYLLLAGVLLGGCRSMSGEYPRSASLIPDAGIRLAPEYVLALEDAVLIAGVAYLTYKVVDPAAPSWKIQEVHLNAQRYRFNLAMKSFSNGGVGEARQVLARRAAALAAEQGYGGWQIQRYEESIDSRLMWPQRTAEAEVALINKL